MGYTTFSDKPLYRIHDLMILPHLAHLHFYQVSRFLRLRRSVLNIKTVPRRAAPMARRSPWTHDQGGGRTPWAAKIGVGDRGNVQEFIQPFLYNFCPQNLSETVPSCFSAQGHLIVLCKEKTIRLGQNLRDVRP